jgi:hypothetical protein
MIKLVEVMDSVDKDILNADAVVIDDLVVVVEVLLVVIVDDFNVVIVDGTSI